MEGWGLVEVERGVVVEVGDGGEGAGSEHCFLLFFVFVYGGFFAGWMGGGCEGIGWLVGWFGWTGQV